MKHALFFAVFLASTVGLALSFAVLALLRPALPVFWRWAGQGIALHAGLWLTVHSLLLMILGRPWFSMAISLAFLMLLVQVSNAKYHSLREVFVFQDFEYFTDAIRHPRLYIPFLGWWKFAMIVVMVLSAMGIGLWLSKTIVESHHGTIGFETCTTSGSSSGSSFTVTLPVHTEDLIY